VQRLSVKIGFDAGEDTSMVRAGMSVTPEIDTGHTRKLADIF
jgi:multidrug resistance efflux pump